VTARKANAKSRAAASPSSAVRRESFAVQLLWAVRPIDLASVPAVDIFGEYRLYAVECREGGRKWYALRLGFFGNATSAQQVANYLRCEFGSVAVLPVSEMERTHAAARPGSAEGIARRGSFGRRAAQGDHRDDKVRPFRIDVHRTRAFQQLIALVKQRERGS